MSSKIVLVRKKLSHLVKDVCSIFTISLKISLVGDR